MGRRGRDRANQRRHRESVRWAAIGAVAAVVAIPVAIALAIWPSRDSSSEGKHQARTPAPTTARVVVQQTPENAIFPVSVADLPRPPTYVPDPEDQQESHCHEWTRWLKAEPAAMLSYPTLAVSAPAAAAATITAVRIRIYRAAQPRETSLVRCHEGGGGYEPTYLQVNFARPQRPPILFKDQQGGKIGPIPDAVFSVPAGRTETLALVARGGSGIFYEWGIELDVIVDNRKRTIARGTKREPFRSWLGELPTSTVDYDVSSRQWERIQ